MLERQVLKSLVQRTSQRVQRTSAARVMVPFGRSLSRSFGRFARSIDRSIAWAIARSLARSIARSLGCSLARLLGRSLSRSLARSLPRSVDRPLDRSLDQMPNSPKFHADALFQGFEFRNIDMLGNDLGVRIRKIELLARDMFIFQAPNIRLFILLNYDQTFC